MSNPITPQGLSNLKKELEYLQYTKRPQVIRAISEAREHGDLKENAEYHAAKEDQAMLEARIALLDSTIKSSEIIDVKEYKNDGRVIFGSTITLKNCDNGKKMIMRIVGELEANFSQGTVSSQAPLIKLCLGKYLGDQIEFNRGDETIVYEIDNVEYIGD